MKQHMNKKSKEIYEMFLKQMKEVEKIDTQPDKEISSIGKQIKTLKKKIESLNNERWDSLVLLHEKLKKEKIWKISRVPTDKSNNICLLCKNYKGTPYSYYYKQEGLSGGMVNTIRWNCSKTHTDPETCKSFDLSESRCKDHKNYNDDLELWRKNKITYDKIRDHDGPQFCELDIDGDYCKAYKRLKNKMVI